MTHNDASVETGVGGQAKYDVMTVFCGNALQKHHKTLKTSTRRYGDLPDVNLNKDLLVFKLFVHFFPNCSPFYLLVIW